MLSDDEHKPSVDAGSRTMRANGIRGITSDQVLVAGIGKGTQIAADSGSAHIIFERVADGRKTMCWWFGRSSE